MDSRPTRTVALHQPPPDQAWIARPWLPDTRTQDGCEHGTHVTISGGSAITGSNVYNSSGAMLYLQNTLVANSSGGDDCANDGALNHTNTLIQDGTCSPTFSGDPLLSYLGNYGGPAAGPGQVLQTFALLPGSPAINTGDGGTCETSDQRGESRVGACDIGAFESQGFNLAISGGNDQSAVINTAFAAALQVSVTANVITEPVGAGGVISFTAPGSGASIVTPILTTTSDSGGVASATVTANSTEGTYPVIASANGASNSVTFSLTNTVNHSLTVNVVGSGTITPTSGVYLSVTVLSLQVTPDYGWQFDGWTGDLVSSANPVSLTLDADRAITATFSLRTVVPTYTLTALVSPPGSGQVTLDPPGGVYAENTVVQLTAVPTQGYVFAAWSGNLTGTTSVATVTLTQDVNVTASFALAQFQVYLPLVIRR